MFRRYRLAGLLWACSLAVASCTGEGDAPTPEPLRSADQTVVYGEDSRLDYYAHPDQGLRDLTRNAIVAMVNASDLNDRDPDNIRINGRTLGEAYNLCEGERFMDHPTGASCSGTLIDDNLVLTAGHCISERNCSSRLWVFDYYYAEEGELETIGPDDVYACARLVSASSGGGGGWGGGGSDPDYAIVELDRPVIGRTPAVYNPAQWPVEDGDRVSMIGFGSGIPAKLDDGGVVLDENRQGDQNEFRATVDAFGGNSGSGVFNEDYEVVGILVSGETDYENVGRCTRVAELPEAGGPQGGEAVTYAYLAVQELCDNGYPSEALCNIAAICGDGICNNDETWETCPEDCESPVFIDPDWECDPEFYGNGDGCDCECGAYDPDCDDPRQQVFNCLEGQFCDDNGECASDDDPVEPGPEPGPTVPADWACDASYYDAGDGCDCVCGAYDLDCDDPEQEVYNCVAGQFCDDNGECADPDPVDPEPAPDAGTGGGEGEVVDGPDAGGDDGTVTFFPRDGTSTTGCAAASHQAPVWPGLLLLGLVAIRRRA